MIIKISRSTRKKNIIETYVQFPPQIDVQTAYRLLGNRSNGINIKRATIQQVNINQITKLPIRYDLTTNQVIR